jgi:hypothetical protein
MEPGCAGSGPRGATLEPRHVAGSGHGGAGLKPRGTGCHAPLRVDLRQLNLW